VTEIRSGRPASILQVPCINLWLDHTWNMLIVSVWYPKRNIDVDKLERVHKRATKLIPELSKKSYSDRLKALKLPSLKYRRYRGRYDKIPQRTTEDRQS